VKSLRVLRGRPADPRPERRKNQRRQPIPRRLGAERRKVRVAASESERRTNPERRRAAVRRRRPDRRIGISRDLDLSLLGF